MDKHNYTKFSVAFSVFKFVSVAKPQPFKKKKKKWWASEAHPAPNWH